MSQYLWFVDRPGEGLLLVVTDVSTTCVQAIFTVIHEFCLVAIVATF